MQSLVELNTIEMHGTGVKIIDDQQAKIYNAYKNSKLKFSILSVNLTLEC